MRHLLWHVRTRVSALRRAGNIPTWRLACATLTLIVFTCLPLAESLFSPLDRGYRQLVTRQDAYGALDHVAVIMIDNRSVKALGVNRCFAQSSHARLLERLHSAASVVIDLMLLCDERDGPDLAAALARHGRVVLPAYVSPETVDPEIVLPPAAALSASAASVAQKSIVVGVDDIVKGFLPAVNVPTSGQVLGHVITEAIRVSGQTLPMGQIDDYIQDNISSLGTRQQGVVSMLLPARFHLKRYSYSDVLAGAISEAEWRGKIVFIGSSLNDRSTLYNLSGDAHPASRVHGTEAIAMMAEALLDGHVLVKPPIMARLGVNAITLVGILLICLTFSGWRLYAVAVSWLVLYVTLNDLALQHLAYWMPPGAVLGAASAIFALIGWRRASTLSASLVRLYRQLQRITPQSPVPPAGGQARPGLFGHARIGTDKVAHIMKEIRVWQSGYLELMETLPYAVFVEERGRLVMCNARGRSLLAALSIQAAAPRLPDHPILGQVRDAIGQARASGHMRSFEVTLQARTHTIMVAPFSDGTRYDSAASLICVLDIHDLRAEIESDQVTLRHMAHDMRSPLATVRSMLEEHLQANTHADAAFIDSIHKLVDYSLRVTQGYTDLSRAGHLDAGSFVDIDVDDLIAEAVDCVWHTACAKNIEITARPNETPAYIHGHRDMLLRAVVNLLDNAIKYSPDHTAVKVTVATRASWVEIAVEDQGVGVPQHARKHLFEPFFQVAAGSAGQNQGVGLGLSFVQAVVKQHLGTITVASSPGSGSCFTLRLPQTQPHESLSD